MYLRCLCSVSHSRWDARLAWLASSMNVWDTFWGSCLYLLLLLLLLFLLLLQLISHGFPSHMLLKCRATFSRKNAPQKAESCLIEINFCCAAIENFMHHLSTGFGLWNLCKISELTDTAMRRRPQKKAYTAPSWPPSQSLVALSPPSLMYPTAF